MFWVRLKRTKVRVCGQKFKSPLRGISSTDEHTHFLQSLLTNDVKSLKPFTFNYNLWLKRNGQPITDFFVYKLEDCYLLDSQEEPDFLIEKFNEIKLSLKITFENLSEEYAHLFLFGEGVMDFVEKRFGVRLKEFEFKNFGEVFIARNPLRVGEEGFDLFGKVEELVEKLEGKEVSLEEFEYIRIKNCIPKMHKELREGFSPLEAGLLNYAISLNKGCYVGQEAIARIYFKGRIPRLLVKFKTYGKVKEGDRVLHNGKEVGLITSTSSRGDLALGYLLREHFKEGAEFKTDGGKVKTLKACLYY